MPVVEICVLLQEPIASARYLSQSVIYREQNSFNIELSLIGSVARLGISSVGCISLSELALLALKLIYSN